MLLSVARVYVVRHAEAAPGVPDESRALTPVGHEQARAVAARLARVEPDAVLSSPLLRARQTAAAIAAAAGAAAEVDERLAPGADVDAVRAAVEGRGEVVVVVGHQPDCGEVVAAVRDVDEPRFPPGGVHAIDLGP